MNTKFTIEVGDLTTFCGDGLICSANSDLNLSGGVGGAFGLKFGDSMQKDLRRWQEIHQKRLLSVGEIVSTDGNGWPFRHVLHCVAVDTFYNTDVQIVTKLYQDALVEMNRNECQSVFAACLGCGYGRLSNEQFCEVYQLVKNDLYTNLQSVQFVTRDRELVEYIENSELS